MSRIIKQITVMLLMTLVIVSITPYCTQAAKKVTVTLKANGGAPISTRVKVKKKKKYGKLPTPERDGYTFTGWYTKTKGGSLVGEKTKVKNSKNHTLYAHWKANSYRVSFAGNGGKSELSSKDITFDQKYGTLPGALRKGRTFLGWYTDDENGTLVKGTTKMVTSQNHILYAHWKANTYKVTFLPQGGEVTVKEKMVTYGEAFGTLPTPKRTGYTFAGWYTQAGVKKGSGSGMWEDANISLYARWNIISYPVNFSGNGGSVTPASKSIQYNHQIGTLPTPKRTGYTFTGWYTGKTDGTKVTSNTKITKKMTIYARWTINQYNVSYNSNGADVSISGKKVNYNTAIGTLPVPQRTGCTFDGWYTQKTDGTKYTSTTKITSHVTLYAHWTPLIYTIHYDGNEKSSGSMADVTFTVENIPAIADSGFAMKNCTFAGWSTKKNGKVMYQPGDKPVSISNLEALFGSARTWTLYAVWTGNTSKTSFYSTAFQNYLAGEGDWNRFSDGASSIIEDKCSLIPGYKVTNVGSYEGLESYAATGYVPQAVCQTDKYLLITAYDVEGNFGSVIYVKDFRRNYKTTIMLDFKSHVGGIAYMEERKEIYISDTEQKGLHIISADLIEDLVAQNKDVVSLSLNEDAEFIKTSKTPSFVTTFNGSIYTGVFQEVFNPDKPNYLMRMDYSEDGWKETKINVALPAQTQGISFVEYGGKTYMICSCSYGRKNASRMYLYEVDRANEDNWICTINYSEDPYLVFPNMSEGIFFGGGDELYTCFESAANYYQYKSGKTTKLTVGKDIFPIDRVTANSMVALLQILYPLEEETTVSYSSGGDIASGMQYRLYSNGEMVITGNGELTDDEVKEISKEERDQVTNVIVGDAITAVEEETFDEFAYLEHVTTMNENTAIDASEMIHEHDFVFEETVKPTCGSFGFDIYGCECGQKSYRNPTALSGEHHFKELSKDEEGSAFECEKCGYYYIEVNN